MDTTLRLCELNTVFNGSDLADFMVQRDRCSFYSDLHIYGIEVCVLMIREIIISFSQIQGAGIGVYVGSPTYMIP